MTEIIRMKLLDIQPSQLYINRNKYDSVLQSIEGGDNILPVPVVKFKNGYIFTDGHSRALVSYLRGDLEIDVFHDRDELNMEAYRICVEWCLEENITSIADLKYRIIDLNEYRRLWIDRCHRMHEELKMKRQVK